ncbi:MAG TPA: hypothetical protein VJ576_12325 [Rhodocyclaceae bacterium]|nr:hypothetical protein [Rhodocyclaceae bacterium]
MNRTFILTMALALAAGSAWAQTSQRTRIQGNTEINANTNNMTAVATGRDTVAKNRVGVIQGDKRGDTRISVSAGNVVTIAGGRGKKACTNIGGVVSNECK